MSINRFCLAALALLMTACAPLYTTPPLIEFVPSATPTIPTPTQTPTATFPSTFVRPTLPPTWTPTATFTPTGEVTYTLTPTNTPGPFEATATLPPVGRNTIAFVAYDVALFGYDSSSIVLLDIDAGKTYTIMSDVFNKSYLSWSPDGTQIAFQGTAPTNRQTSQIFTIGIHGDTRIQVSRDTKLARTPAWSPDGKVIAYVARGEHDVDTDIFLASPDGSSITRLIDDLVDELSPTWSPDGTQIAFGQPLNGQNSTIGIFIMNTDGSNLHQIGQTTGTNNPNLAWSPDGRQIVFVSDHDERNNPDLYVMSIDGGPVRRLTTEPGWNIHPTWSPDGSRIVYESSNTHRLMIMNADGSNQHSLNVSGAYPAFRPG